MGTRALRSQHEAGLHVSNSLGRTPLHYAALGGMDEAAKALLAAGADLHVSDDAGVRPIHAAADRGHTRMCALLMDQGAEKVPPTLTEILH